MHRRACLHSDVGERWSVYGGITYGAFKRCLIFMLFIDFRAYFLFGMSLGGKSKMTTNGAFLSWECNKMECTLHQ